MEEITKRILTQLGDTELVEKLLALPGADFNSLMLKVFQAQSDKVTPVEVVKAMQTNRFVVPSDVDPVAYHTLETEFLTTAHKLGIKPILLSPSAPFASSSAFGYVDQKNVVSALRGTEILSDPTNMLAIILAEKLKSMKADNTTPIHYCTTARVLRAQVFPNTGRHFAHFGLFGMVSSGKDKGSYRCEQELLFKQLTFYKELVIQRYKANLSIVLSKRRGYTDGEGFFKSMAELVARVLPDVPLSLNLVDQENNYYQGLNYNINMEKDGEIINIGDGGFVDWIQRMTNNKKERCLISGIGLDRLLLY
ncbi:MAG: hypothetical protein FWE76_02410 [Symbiobacteriaceae bacterium]|nr:hypothetical protein [Symbiobacteriaceae bacterium]